MTTSPVVSLTDEMVAELEALANDAKGWNMPKAFMEPDAFEVEKDWEWYVGQIDEEGNQYPVLHVNAHQYDSEDSEKLARYYAACNLNTILALLAERAELKRDAERYRWMRDYLRHDYKRWESAGAWNHANIQAGEFDAAIDAAMETEK